MANSAVPYIEAEKKKPIRGVLKDHQREFSEVAEICDDLRISRDTLKRYLDAHGGKFVRTIWLPDDEQP
jgi:transcriptional regulator with PAS, ATPase and Fis domain